MYRFLLTPRWLGITLFAVLAIPVCLFMGSWQLSRFDARVAASHKQQKTVAESAHSTAQPLSKLLPVDLKTSGRAAKATGRYDRGHPLLVPGRQLGRKDGTYVLSLLRTAGAGSGRNGGKGGGKALPVVRGWLPGHPGPAEVPPPPRGEVSVTGVLQASESPGSPGVQDGGALPKGRIGMISAASLVNVVPYDVYDAWITVRKTPQGSGLKPVPASQPANSGLDMKAFQNLGYTAEWFVFAGFVVFMWFRFFRRDLELARDAKLGLLPDADAPDADAPDADALDADAPETDDPEAGEPGTERPANTHAEGSGSGTEAPAPESSRTGSGDAADPGDPSGPRDPADPADPADPGDPDRPATAPGEDAGGRSQSPASTA